MFCCLHSDIYILLCVAQQTSRGLQDDLQMNIYIYLIFIISLTAGLYTGRNILPYKGEGLWKLCWKIQSKRLRTTVSYCLTLQICFLTRWCHAHLWSRTVEHWAKIWFIMTDLWGCQSLESVFLQQDQRLQLLHCCTGVKGVCEIIYSLSRHSKTVWLTFFGRTYKKIFSRMLN